MAAALLASLWIAWVQPLVDGVNGAAYWEWAIVTEDGLMTPFTRIDSDTVITRTDSPYFGHTYDGWIPDNLPAGLLYIRACNAEGACTGVEAPRAIAPTDPGTCERADQDGNGIVNAFDFGIWRQWFGLRCS